MSQHNVPLITVGLPVHNGMPYLPETMESLLAQTFPEFEILAIDDGSTDSSLEYLRSVRDPRLRVISQENRGITAALNRMLAEVKTPWLARQDADDVAYPSRLARTVEHIRAHPDAGMFYSLAEYYPIGSFGRFRSTRGTPEQIRELVLSGYLPAICHPTVTLNAAKVVEIGGYRFNLHVEDVDLWWRMALRHDIRLIPEVLVGFRQNVQSVSSKNLAIQAVNYLYIQYLLLSQLRGVQPLGCEEVRPILTSMHDSGRFEFKTHMRAFNMEMGKGNKVKGMYQAARAFAASPSAFLLRTLDEFGRERMVHGGEPTAIFAKYEKELWPAAGVEGPSELESVGMASRTANFQPSRDAG